MEIKEPKYLALSITGALRKAVEKWRGVYSGKVQDLGIDNCALCILFAKDKRGWCFDCPVKLDTDQPCCSGTPYTAWDDLFEENESMFANNPERKEKALAMLKYLINLTNEYLTKQGMERIDL